MKKRFLRQMLLVSFTYWLSSNMLQIMLLEVFITFVFQEWTEHCWDWEPVMISYVTQQFIWVTTYCSHCHSIYNNGEIEFLLFFVRRWWHGKKNQGERDNSQDSTHRPLFCEQRLQIFSSMPQYWIKYSKRSRPQNRNKDIFYLSPKSHKKRKWF